MAFEVATVIFGVKYHDFQDLLSNGSVRTQHTYRKEAYSAKEEIRGLHLSGREYAKEFIRYRIS